MEFWEFLIQKEGDRSWLPLESPSAEILEGRYRVVARSNRASVPTEIRVAHYATTEEPPVQRVRKRSGQTNADGLIVIMPFTRLQPGLWDLHCTGDVMAEMMGETWQHRIQLEVLPQEASLLDDWEPEWSGPVPVASAEPVTTTSSAVSEANPPSGEHPLDSALLASVLSEPVSSPVSHPEATPEENTTPASETEVPQISTEPAVASPSTEMAEIWQQVEQVSQQIVESAFSNLEEFAIGTTDRPQALNDGVAPPSGSAKLQVVLEQETFVIQRNQPLLLTGHLEPVGHLSPDEQPCISELRVRLYDPQTSQILMDEVHPIANCRPPFPFSGTIALPEHYQTYLVLGELLFQGHYGSEAAQVLATRAFNVTTDLHELIESIANDFPDIEALPPEARLPETTELVSPAELDRLSAQAPALFRRSAPSTLPPQLRPPDPTRTHASLDLPSFNLQAASFQATGFQPPLEPDLSLAPEANPLAASPNNQTEPLQIDLEDGIISTSAADLQLEQPSKLARESIQKSLPERLRRSLRLSVGSPEGSSSQTDSELSDLANPLSETIDQPDTPEKSTPEGRLPATQPSDLIEDSADLFADWGTVENRSPIWQQRQSRPIDQSDSPEDVSFRALNLENRFWSRLQSLAANPEVSANLNSSEFAGTQDKTSTEAAIQPRSASSLDAELTAGEFVVEDDALPILAGTDAAHATEPIDPELLGPVLPEDEPIPTPRLQLPTGELVAGQPIGLSIKLPNLEARVYIKLWLRDRQTRTLLGPPRWLIDFVPDGFGNQVARTEVIVPPGCLKVQFEAIAVEIATQRESDKTTLTRPIMPPDLSPLSLDSLEI